MLRHEPRDEIWVGTRTTGTEVPERARIVRAALEAAGHEGVDAVTHDDDLLLAVHDPAMVAWLRHAARLWAEGPYEALVSQDRVVPYVFPTPGMTAGMPWREPQATHARAGVWCYDTMTLVGPGTWEAARGAVDCALTAVDLVAGDPAAGGLSATERPRAVLAVTRPPGHHAAPAAFGGSCYLNNAAVAAHALLLGAERVAVLDVDAHHGNGTQAAFWRRPDVLYGSVHVDPGAGWFPHIHGFADETGDGEGAGATCNVPLAPGSADAAWLDGVRHLVDAAARFEAQTLVVSLGVDAAAADPESPLQVSHDGYARTGALLAALDVPTVLVLEGGYHLPTLGGLVASVAAAF